jgi:predicted nucleotide-binding protein
MTTDEIIQLLESTGLRLKERTRLTNGSGEQARFLTGEIINVFDSGTINVQGKNKDVVERLLGSSGAGIAMAKPSARHVFVAYGHDTPARTQLEAMLRRWGLEPLILDQLPSEGQTIIEKLEKYANDDIVFGVVLATPDDEGHVAGKPDENKYRARQNVVLELGLLLAKLGRPRVAILLKSQEKMDRPSDIQGLIYIPFTDDVEETKVLLAKEMEKQGIHIPVARL